MWHRSILSKSRVCVCVADCCLIRVDVVTQRSGVLESNTCVAERAMVFWRTRKLFVGDLEIGVCSEAVVFVQVSASHRCRSLVNGEWCLWPGGVRIGKEM